MCYTVSMKTPINQKNYTNIITALVNNAVLHTEGVSANEALLTKQRKNLLTNNIGLIFDENRIIIDVYIDVVFGYSVKEVACNLQEKIINDIKENTDLIVKNVNIIVNNVILN